MKIAVSVVVLWSLRNVLLTCFAKVEGDLAVRAVFPQIVILKPRSFHLFLYNKYGEHLEFMWLKCCLTSECAKVILMNIVCRRFSAAAGDVQLPLVLPKML